MIEICNPGTINNYFLLKSFFCKAEGLFAMGENVGCGELEGRFELYSVSVDGAAQ
jgi:hypothetical protein